MIISVFNNKGGVGKTTLLYHIGAALAELGKKVLLLDLDPQCNLTIQSLEEKKIKQIWDSEEEFIEDFKTAKEEKENFIDYAKQNHSIHFLLKPLEDGVDVDFLSRPINLMKNLDIIPGRLSLQFFESTISQRWSEAFTGSSQAVRIISGIRNIALKYKEAYKYDYILLDTSPSLGDLNRISVTLSDAFLIPCSPDIFSIYGIKNIGKSLDRWTKNFNILFSLLPISQRKMFPEKLVKLIGYTLYKAQKREDASNSLKIPQAHYNHAKEIYNEIKKNISKDIYADVCIEKNIGDKSVIYTNNTYPSQSQKYHIPMWQVPSCKYLDSEDKGTINSNRDRYYNTKRDYTEFAKDLIERLTHV